MDVFEVARTVLAVREFSSSPVPKEEIRKILQSARLTGSSMNRQPWHFVVVNNRSTLMELGTLVSSGPYTAQAAFAVVVAIEKSSRFAISDASRAIQSMVLTAWSYGIGSNWTGWIGMTQVASLLKVPENLDVIAVLPFGYPLEIKNRGSKRRKPFSEVVHLEQYGRPFS